MKPQCRGFVWSLARGTMDRPILRFDSIRFDWFIRWIESETHTEHASERVARILDPHLDHVRDRDALRVRAHCPIKHRVSLRTSHHTIRWTCAVDRHVHERRRRVDLRALPLVRRWRIGLHRHRERHEILSRHNHQRSRGLHHDRRSEQHAQHRCARRDGRRAELIRDRHQHSILELVHGARARRHTQRRRADRRLV